jgi:hypothetical protein
MSSLLLRKRAATAISKIHGKSSLNNAGYFECERTLYNYVTLSKSEEKKMTTFNWRIDSLKKGLSRFPCQVEDSIKLRL